MGNLVTNIIKFERRDGKTGVRAFEPILSSLTAMPKTELIRELELQKNGVHWARAPFDMSLIAPEPAIFGYQGASVDPYCLQLPLALLSTPECDFLEAFKKIRLPYSNHRYAALRDLTEAGLADEDPDVRLARAYREMPEEMLAAEVAIAAFEATGHFDPISWRARNWGTRSHAEVIHFFLERENLGVKFDTLNAGPNGWLRKFAAATPQFHFSGVSFDEDTNYSLHFTSEEPGEIDIVERSDPDGVFDARCFEHGFTAEEMREYDEDFYPE
ncbi:hypothetical protein QCN27_19755 [Cereibacter sp. SYSU M97828]|nr:hypothetical protein [Cereibacter flavus]